MGGSWLFLGRCHRFFGFSCFEKFLFSITVMRLFWLCLVILINLVDYFAKKDLCGFYFFYGVGNLLIFR